jgi:hypothetical protein
MTWLRTTSACERARFLAALAPDQALSEMEERILERHLARCPSCRRFAASVVDVAAELRAAPLAEPELNIMASVRWRRQRVRRSMKLPLVAMTSVVTGMMLATITLSERVAPPAALAPQPFLLDAKPENEVVAIRQFRRLALERVTNQAPPPGQPGMYVE